METAFESQTPELVLELLKYFVEIKDKEAFCACTYVCYSLLSPDDVLELAWKAGFFEFCVPYFVQLLRDYCGRIHSLDKKITAKEKKDEEKAE